MQLSPLSRRLIRVAESPGNDWRILTENCPVWPDTPTTTWPGWKNVDDTYAPSQGVKRLLDALVDREAAFDVALDRQSLLITNGALDALALVSRHLRDHGAKRVFCAGPILSCVHELLTATGLSVVVIDWRQFVDEASWQTPGLGSRDVVYINTPHNPTGACLSEHHVRSLLDAQQSSGFNLIFDLVVDSFNFSDEVMRTPLSSVKLWKGIFGLNSFSKNYGAPGLRIGWITAAPTAIRQMTVRMEFERIAVSTSAQHRALELCLHGNQPLRDRVQAGFECVAAIAANSDLGCSPAMGGTQAWLDLGIDDCEAFADRLLDEVGLVVTTGANYYPRQSNCLRLPTGVEISTLKAAMRDIINLHDAFTSANDHGVRSAGMEGNPQPPVKRPAPKT